MLSRQDLREYLEFFAVSTYDAEAALIALQLSCFEVFIQSGMNGAIMRWFRIKMKNKTDGILELF
ncbi:MAG: hypothetical protein K6C08_11425 [Oscillospiraceae bacterium]|nr:hypothetical protein [Oscillospiraceae bacterium]